MKQTEIKVLMDVPREAPRVVTLKTDFHDLRHLCASIMLMQGVNVKVAQERLGHADISTTLNIYSHVLPSSAKEAAEKIGAMVYDSVAV